MQVRYRTHQTHKKGGDVACTCNQSTGDEVHIKMLRGSKCSLGRLRSWLALFLVVNCLVTFMALINKICEQISLIDVVQGVAVWHVSMEVVIQVHNQSNTKGFWILFWFIFFYNVAVVSEYNEIFWLRSVAVIGFWEFLDLT